MLAWSLGVVACGVAHADPAGAISWGTTMSRVFEVVVLVAGMLALAGGAALWWRAAGHGYAPRLRTGHVASRRRFRLLMNVTCGGVLADFTPLTSPMGDLECLAWTLKVDAAWHDGDVLKLVRIHEDAEYSAFSLDDGSGPIRVCPQAGDRIEWVPSHAQDREYTLLDAVFERPIEARAGRPIEISPAQRAQLPERVEFLRVSEAVLPVAERYVATGVAAPEGGLMSSSGQPLVLVRDLLPRILWVGRSWAETVMMIGAGFLAIGIALGWWLSAGE